MFETNEFEFTEKEFVEYLNLFDIKMEKFTFENFVKIQYLIE